MLLDYNSTTLPTKKKKKLKKAVIPTITAIQYITDIYVHVHVYDQRKGFEAHADHACDEEGLKFQ